MSLDTFKDDDTILFYCPLIHHKNLLGIAVNEQEHYIILCICILASAI